MSKDNVDSDDIFTDDYSKNQKDDPIEQSEFTPPPKTEDEKDTLDSDWEIPESEEQQKPARSKKKMILGAVVIGLIVGGMAFIVEFLGKDIDLNPIELGESIDKQNQQGSGGTNDVSSATDKVELEVTNDPIGYFVITTKGVWYGDYVDFREIPSKINENGTKKINFRCYTDEFAGTSTYFGNFRNVIEDEMTIEVYIRGIEVETQSTKTNKAIIVEGDCLQ